MEKTVDVDPVHGHQKTGPLLTQQVGGRHAAVLQVNAAVKVCSGHADHRVAQLVARSIGLHEKRADTTRPSVRVRDRQDDGKIGEGAMVIYCLHPLRTYSSPSLTALVWMPVASETEAHQLTNFIGWQLHGTWGGIADHQCHLCALLFLHLCRCAVHRGHGR